MAIAKVYTLNADFDEGLLVNVNHTVVADQLQLNALVASRPFSFIHVPCSGRSTVVRIDTNAGTIVGEYKSKPDGQSGNPSRIASDRFGNVYVGNRDATAGTKGSVTKIGLTVGGTRCDLDGTPNASGDYVKDWSYTTCRSTVPGLIKTSRGLTDIRTWTTDDGTGPTGTVTAADDD